MNINKGEKIAKELKGNYPNPKTELNYMNEYELVVAVALSAQTTDRKVNEVTPILFKKYPGWSELKNADISELKEIIKPVNFYKGKAERLILAAEYIVRKHSGIVPNTIEQLIKIPGYARKSANVILKELWGKAEGIVVDTHVSRVSMRLGLTDRKEPVKIEQDLISVIPKEYWVNFSGSAVLHGRYTCTARKPKCDKCFLNKLCNSAFKV